MKTLLRFCSICFLLTLFVFNCSSNASSKSSIKVTFCDSNFVFEDLDNNVYAYRADALFSVASIQAGGHSTVDESTDLGVNIFLDLDDLEKMAYTIDYGSTEAGTAFVYYNNGENEYSSTGNFGGSFVVDRLELDNDGKVLVLEGSINNVELANKEDDGDIICVNGFQILYELEEE